MASQFPIVKPLSHIEELPNVVIAKDRYTFSSLGYKEFKGVMFDLVEDLRLKAEDLPALEVVVSIDRNTAFLFTEKMIRQSKICVEYESVVNFINRFVAACIITVASPIENSESKLVLGYCVLETTREPGDVYPRRTTIERQELSEDPRIELKEAISQLSKDKPEPEFEIVSA